MHTRYKCFVNELCTDKERQIREIPTGCRCSAQLQSCISLLTSNIIYTNKIKLQTVLIECIITIFESEPCSMRPAAKLCRLIQHGRLLIKCQRICTRKGNGAYLLAHDNHRFVVVHNTDIH